MHQPFFNGFLQLVSMTQQMHDVSMLTDKEVTIEGEKYQLEEGDVVSLSFTTARNYVNQFGVAEFHGSKYPVTDEAYEDEVGPTGENVNVEPEDNPSLGSDEALESDDEEETEEEEDESEEDSEQTPDNDDLVAPEEWLDMRTVDEVEEDVQEFDEPDEFLGHLSEFAERKGAQEAIDARIEELEPKESEAEDAEEDQEEEE